MEFCGICSRPFRGEYIKLEDWYDLCMSCFKEHLPQKATSLLVNKDEDFLSDLKNERDTDPYPFPKGLI